jgi:hypothetical protein
VLRRAGDVVFVGNRSDSALVMAERFQWRSAGRAKSPNIPHGRLAEEAAIFPIELAGTLVSNLKCRARGVQTTDEHAFACCLQAELLLILEWTHGGEGAEMVVQRGEAHARDLREIFHAQRFRVVCPDPGDRLCGALALISQSCNGTKARSRRRLKNPVDDLALDEPTEKQNVFRVFQQRHKAAAGAEQLRV